MMSILTSDQKSRLRQGYGGQAEIRDRKAKSRGAAIMLALWALFLLSALVISWALDIDSRLSLSGDGTRMLKAEAVACSGAEVALHPAVNPGSPNLSGQLDNGASYQARLTGEGGRLNLNWLAAGEDPDRLAILRRYLEIKGIDLNERETMVDSLLDWVEPNTGLHHLNAPPESEDYHPPHTLLTRIDELKKVAGWADFTSTPSWDDDFTLNSSGPVDLAWAPRDVLLALPGLTPEVVDRFLQARQGPDGIHGTEDDMQFGSIDDVRLVLGLNQEQFKQLSGLISFKDPVLRVVSVGRAGKATRTVQMVFRRVGVVPQLITWKEF
jgi:general secretion pathway protein K